MCVQKWVRCLFVVCLVGMASALTACGTLAPCEGTFSQLSFNPNGSQCEKICHCNNQAYEGICLDGRCRSRLRDYCSVKAQIRGCKLLAPAEGTTCLDGTQPCHPDGLTERRWGDCKPLESIAKEEDTKALCLDRIDNDCDGKVDLEETACKDFCNRGDTRQCYTGKAGTLNVGRCANGTQYCDPSTNQWFSTCEAEATPAAEICNGVDDNCDGKVDEGLPECLCREDQKDKQEPCFTGPVGAETFGICRAGRRVCKQVEKGLYRWGKCENEVLPKQQEECNSLDDNCDGIIDEGCPCKEPLTRSCGHDIGECRQGEQRCIQGKWGRTCYARVAPRGEACDGRDNDCNGYIDDRLLRACKSACGVGTETCVAGKWEGCDAPPSAAETCNNKDDDCDGTVDNGLARKCATACGDGVEQCVKGAWTKCAAASPPAETCNDKDDDCDGLTDEGLSRTCETACGKGVEICEKGKWSTCATSNPPPETCNDKDDDCDGLTDENLTRTCKTPCGTSVQICEKGAWGACTKPTVQPELCNGVDDDCNGTVDDIPKRACDTTKCLSGDETCTGGVWVGCKREYPKETCNKLDDNCDGRVDEGLTRDCKGITGISACIKGRNFCIDGAWKDSNGDFYGCVDLLTPEVCDGLDNDCDGTIDGNTRPCTNGCNTGVETCSAGKWSCAAMPTPPEVDCDGKDNDCDGDIDENLTRACNDPAITGAACLQGSNLCIKGAYQDPQTKDYYGCIKVAPPEDCNGKDDDCDGDIDEGNLTRPCDATTCMQGTETCDVTTATCNDSNCVRIAKTEVCNGIDDDCNGQIDEGNLKGCVTLLVGTPKAAGRVSGPAATSSFSSPQGMRVENFGMSLWIMDTGNNAIREVVLDSSGTPTATKLLAGSPTGASGATNGTGSSASFNAPTNFGNATDENGFIVIVDTGNHKLRNLNPNTFVVTDFSGIGAPPGHANGGASLTKFHTPLDVFAFSGPSRLDYLVADSLNHRIRLITGGQAGTSIYGNSADYAGSGTSGFKDATGAAAEFNSPSFMRAGYNAVLVFDTGNHCIRSIADGTLVVKEVVGKCKVSGTADGLGNVARLNGPRGGTGFLLSTQGILIADTENHCIRQLDYNITRDEYKLSTYAGVCGTAGYKNGLRTQALFNRPTHIIKDGTGSTIYIADTGNHVIRRILR